MFFSIKLIKMTLSIIIETATNHERSKILQCLAIWKNLAEESFAKDYEIIALVPEELELIDSEHERISFVRHSKEDIDKYYLQKNMGFNHAAGRFCLFADCDCVPNLDYLSELKEILESSSEVVHAGITNYQGKGLITTFNTYCSFGYLVGKEKVLFPQGPLSHNIIINGSIVGDNPFGPFKGRVYGDWHFSKLCYEKSLDQVVHNKLIMNHVSPNWNLHEIQDRYFREIFNYKYRHGDKSDLSCIKSVLKKRYMNIVKYKTKNELYSIQVLQLYIYQSLISMVVYSLYFLLILKGGRLSWINHQFGEKISV